MRPLFAAALLWSISSIFAIGAASAQELEPRAYTPAPVGLNFLAVIAGRSTGGVVVDPSLPVEDVEASVNSLSVGLGKTIDMFGRTALVVAALPYVWADASGRIGEAAARATRSGLADPRIKVSVNLLGGRALSPREFARAPRSTIVGTSIGVAPPLGQYYRTKLVNIGANRWSFKPEIGISHVKGNWTIDGYAGMFLFTRNDAFYTGTSRRTQQPIVAVQAHASYTVRPRLWIAFDSTWYSGGTTIVDGVEKSDLQRSSRVGVTTSMPLGRQQSLKLSASSGATTRIGADFTTFAAAWQLAWFDN
jgi:hypothetical protein